MNLLVVEDSPDIQMVMLRILRLAGGRLDIEDKGKDGFRRGLALALDFDAVSMDGPMPFMHGLEATRIPIKNHSLSKSCNIHAPSINLYALA